MNDIYMRLATHLQALIMGYPYNDALIDLLKEMFSPVEAEVALAIPNNLEPLEVVSPQQIAADCALPETSVTLLGIGLFTLALASLREQDKRPKEASYE